MKSFFHGGEADCNATDRFPIEPELPVATDEADTGKATRPIGAGGATEPENRPFAVQEGSVRRAYPPWASRAACAAWAGLIFCASLARAGGCDVLYLGDSIRLGCEKHMHCESPGDENCASTRHMLAGLDRWVGVHRWPVVIFNCGLHDVDLTYRVSVNEYEENLRKIVARLRAHADRLYFCTTTPGNAADPQGRTDDLVRAYNATAVKVMIECNVPVVDLYSLAVRHPEWKRSDGIHYTDEGYRALATKITESIASRIR
jgi:hypothetical protein